MTGETSQQTRDTSLLFCFVVFSEVAMPSFIVVDLSIDGYFLPLAAIKKEQDLLDFLDGVLDGSVQVSPDSSDGVLRCEPG